MVKTGDSCIFALMKLKEFRELINSLPSDFDEIEVVAYDSEHEYWNINCVKPLSWNPDTHRREVNYSTPEMLELLEYNHYGK